MDAQQPSVAACSSQKTAEHISASLVGGHDAVRYHECDRTDVVRDNADGHVILIFFSVFFSRQAAYVVPERFYRIHIKDGLHVLHHARQTLQPHAGIDVLLLQLGIMTFPVIVKLGEHIVPYLHVPVAVAAHRAVRLPASVFLAPVIVYFRTGTARTGAVLPEIVLFAELEDALCRDADFFIPYLERLVIVHIDGRIETVRIQSHHLGQELPCPCDGFFFEIVSEGEVPEHLKECAVTGGLSHVLDIAGADALLAGRNALPGRNLLPGKIWF